MFGKIRIDPIDNAFSWIVRTKSHWKCDRCHTRYRPPTRSLQASHYHGRSNWKVRFDYDNVFIHCAGCHSYLGSHPYEFTEWMKKKLGEKRFEELNRRANWRTKEKTDKKLIELWLRQELPKYDLNPDDFFMKKEKSVQCAAHKFVNCTVCHRKKSIKKQPKI